MNINAISTAMNSLSKKRRIFHSEADFQFALAWEIKEIYGWDIQLERFAMVDEMRVSIDIVVIEENNKYPIELKYLKKPLPEEAKDDAVLAEYKSFLRAGSVHSMDMYSCLSDIERIEKLYMRGSEFCKGYVIWLTNDSAFWEDSGVRNDAFYKAFHSPEDAEKTGVIDYFPRINPKTGEEYWNLKMKEYKKAINLAGFYKIKWIEYSNFGIKNTQFKYAVVTANDE